jgi:hypothetical protein
MYRTRVSHEIGAGPWVQPEELERQQIALQLIARTTRDHEVAR